MSKQYVHYGCGLKAPKEWANYDISPTLRIQKTPILGALLKSRLNTVFPSNVMYGNIVKGLPVEDNSTDGVFCCNMLEHLSLEDFRDALKNTYKILKPGGIFRCIVPDLEYFAKEYIKSLEMNNPDASIEFMRGLELGIVKRPRGFKEFIKSFFGNSNHLWMWDEKSLKNELRKVGFIDIRTCKYADSEDEMFLHVEGDTRYNFSVGVQSRK